MLQGQKYLQHVSITFHFLKLIMRSKRNIMTSPLLPRACHCVSLLFSLWTKHTESFAILCFTKKREKRRKKRKKESGWLLMFNVCSSVNNEKGPSAGLLSMDAFALTHLLTYFFIRNDESFSLPARTHLMAQRMRIKYFEKFHSIHRRHCRLLLNKAPSPW